MVSHTYAGASRQAQRGISLVMVAVGLFALLGICALAIDLVVLYVTRNEAQRAADAAALAGAKAIVDSGYLSGLVTLATAQSQATTQAIAIGGWQQNQVGGAPANIQAGDVTFPPCPVAGNPCPNPRITVVVQRTAARGNPMPTFFAKAFGVLRADVRAQATAEAYNPSGSPTGPTICAACVKPLLLPNCDPDPLHALPLNPACATPGQGYFVDPTGAIAHPNAYPAGVVGQQWTLHSNPSPSQYYVVDVGCGNSGQGFRQCMTGCTTALWACGSTLNATTGAQVGPTWQAVDDLIHATRKGPNHGQDTISATAPFPITGGSNNPNPAVVGQTITNSDSLVTVALYNGSPLNPGGNNNVTVVGYMQMFIEYADHQGGNDIIVARILKISGCGARTGTCGQSGGGAGGGTVGGGNGSLVPIRLIRTPGP